MGALDFYQPEDYWSDTANTTAFGPGSYGTEDYWKSPVSTITPSPVVPTSNVPSYMNIGGPGPATGSPTPAGYGFNRGDSGLGRTATPSGGYGSPIPAPDKTLQQYKNFAFQYPVPAQETYPTYTAPKWDESRVSKYASKFASPYISEMRKAIRDAIVRTSSTTSPIQRRYQLGGALEKAGEGYGKIMSQAGQYGAGMYRDEYSRAAEEGKINYTTNVAGINMRNVAAQQQSLALYNAALTDFMAGRIQGIGG